MYFYFCNSIHYPLNSVKAHIQHGPTNIHLTSDYLFKKTRLDLHILFVSYRESVNKVKTNMLLAKVVKINFLFDVPY